MKDKITNTSANPNPEWLMGGNPRAIETQEQDGQNELIAKRDIQQLPVESSKKGDVRQEYRALGIVVLGESKGDPLFYDVSLPVGWHLEPTDHSMWSNLVDETGKERASIFYKAAFYDRKAFINIK